MANSAKRDWVPSACEDYVQGLAEQTSAQGSDQTARWIEELAE